MIQVADLCETCKYYDWGDAECLKGLYLDRTKVVIECEFYEED